MAAGPSEFVDHEHGLVSRTIFVDEDIYRREVDQIFGRCWLFVGHESQVAAPGDFITTFIGEEPIIVCRAPSGRIFAFINTCPGCGSLVCRADEGSASHFRCPPHGWTFNLEGRLVLVQPGGAGDEEKTADWGLYMVARLSAYKGCLFATLDPAAPTLHEYLGDIRWGLDLLVEQGTLIVSSLTRCIVNCNWKLAAEGSVDDSFYGVAHLSTSLAQAGGDPNRRMTELGHTRHGFTIITEYGHGLNAELLDEAGAQAADPLLRWRRNPWTRRRLGSFRMQVRHAYITIFPNLAVSTATRQLYIWHPRGPSRMEAVLVSFTDEHDPPHVRRAHTRAQSLFGPAGLYGRDEPECWEQSTRACRGTVAGRHPVNYQMGLGRGEIVDDEQSPPRIDTLLNEHRQLWFYRNWAQALDAPTWQDWRRTLPRIPAIV